MTREIFLISLVFLSFDAAGCKRGRSSSEIEHDVAEACGFRVGIVAVDQPYSRKNMMPTLTFRVNDHGKMQKEKLCVIKWAKNNHYIFEQVPFIAD